MPQAIGSIHTIPISKYTSTALCTKNVFMKIQLISILLLATFALPPHKTKVWLIGDSTMANKEVKAYPETGWGMPFSYFFDSTVVVDNRAKNGRSTKSFIAENLWQ